jgi:uncharacterized protein
MYVDLMDVLREPGAITVRPVNVEPLTLDDIEVTQPVRGEVRVTNARHNLLVSGHAHTAIRLECSRCLRDFDYPVDLDLEATVPLSFFRKQYGAHMTGANTGNVEIDAEDEPDDETVAIFAAHSLDVLELVRQAIVLQSPIQPLCSPDCPGLPEAVQYKQTEDERWNALKNWQPEHQMPHNGQGEGDSR